MHINNLFQSELVTHSGSYPQYSILSDSPSESFTLYSTDKASLSSHPKESCLISEHLLDIYIQDVLTIRLTCTARELPELVLGRLLSEGIIRSANEIRYLYICKTGRRAKVFLNNSADSDYSDEAAFSVSQDGESESFVELTPTCCTGTHVMNDLFVKGDSFTPVSSARWTVELTRQCDLMLKKDSPLHDATRSTHSAYLFGGNHCLYQSEDIGRHNAIDKVIGRALIDRVDLTKCALYTTGRMPVDVVQKVIRSGIPLIAGKETPTAESLALASAYNLTVVGDIKHDTFTLYTGYEPIG